MKNPRTLVVVLSAVLALVIVFGAVSTVSAMSTMNVARCFAVGNVCIRTAGTPLVVGGEVIVAPKVSNTPMPKWNPYPVPTLSFDPGWEY